MVISLKWTDADSSGTSDAMVDAYIAELEYDLNIAATKVIAGHMDDPYNDADGSATGLAAATAKAKAQPTTTPEICRPSTEDLDRMVQSVVEAKPDLEIPMVRADWPLLADLVEDHVFDRDQLSAWAQYAGTQEYVIDGLVPAPSITLMTGDSGEGKSALAYQEAICVAHGVPYLGRNVKQGPVMIFDGENGVIQGNQLLEQLSKHLKVESCASPQWKYWNLNAMADDYGTPGHTFEDYIRKLKPTLVVLDPIYSFYKDIEKDQPSATAAFTKMRKLMKETGCAIIGICHKRKGPTKQEDKMQSLEKISNVNEYFQQVRGSSAMINGSDVRLAVAKPAGNTGTALIVRGFARMTGEIPTTYINRVFDADGAPLGYNLGAGPDPFNTTHEREAYAALPDQPNTFRYKAIQAVYGGKSDAAIQKFIGRMTQARLLVKLPQRQGYVKGNGIPANAEVFQPDVRNKVRSKWSNAFHSPSNSLVFKRL